MFSADLNNRNFDIFATKQCLRKQWLDKCLTLQPTGLVPSTAQDTVRLTFYMFLCTATSVDTNLTYIYVGANTATSMHNYCNYKAQELQLTCTPDQLVFTLAELWCVELLGAGCFGCLELATAYVVGTSVVTAVLGYVGAT